MQRRKNERTDGNGDSSSKSMESKKRHWVRSVAQEKATIGVVTWCEIAVK